MTPERFPLSAAAGEAARSAAPRWRALLELGVRLPGGLVHAERITVVPRAPDFLTPLTKGSRWHALGTGLVVVADAASGGLAGLLADLGAYRAWTVRVRERWSERPEVAEALTQPLTASLRLELGDLLEASGGELDAVDARAPGLRADMAWMLRRPFDPEIVVHPELLEDRQRTLGVQVADALLAKVPVGRFHLLVSDAATPLELLSPYAEDLGHSLYAWGLENPDALPVPGLFDALAATQDHPERDLAATVAEVLTASAGAPILLERRANEASQGLWLEDGWGATWGVAELGRLEAPDPALILAGPVDVMVVLTGGTAALRVAAVERLAASGRIEGLGIVGRTRLAASEPVVPEALVWAEDAIRLELGVSLARLAQRVGLEARRAGALEVGDGVGVPEWVAQVLQRWRRARILGTLDAQTKPVLALAPQGDRPDSRSNRVRVNTSKLVLVGLLDGELVSRSGGTKTRAGSRSGGVSRRFRA